MDNSTSDSSEFDIELLSTDFDIETLDYFGIDIPSDLNVSIEPNENEFSLEKDLNELRGLIYEPIGEKPTINQLVMAENVKEMKDKISKSNMTKEEKMFCNMALTRFYKFNFRNIAEYYCHSNEEVKEIFTDLLLVIPDGEKLLKNKLFGLDKFIKDEAEDNE